jgi:hypothetical protein
MNGVRVITCYLKLSPCEFCRNVVLYRAVYTCSRLSHDAEHTYILSLLFFVVGSKNRFKLNSNVCNMNTRQKYNYHLPSSNLSLYKKRSLLYWHKSVQTVGAIPPLPPSAYVACSGTYLAF